MLSVSQGMEVGSSGRGASAENDPTAGAVGGGVGGGGGGGDGDEARRRRDIQAVMIAAARDRAIRAESVRHDLALNLPPRFELPDGEEHPYGAHPDLHLRNPEQVRAKRAESWGETRETRMKSCDQLDRLGKCSKIRAIQTDLSLFIFYFLIFFSVSIYNWFHQNLYSYNYFHY